jgi:hypothetical protein
MDKGGVTPEADMDAVMKRKSVPDGYQTLVIYPIAYTLY